MLENLTKKQKIIVFIIAVVVAIGMIYFIYSKNQVDDNINLENDILVSENSTKDSSKETSSDDEVIVHVTGSVKSPGVVKLKEGSRIEDAIEAAGGLTENADISKVNLAFVVEDGTKIRIPSSLDEDIGDGDVVDSGSGENIVVEENTTTSSGKSGQVVNINKASESELETLPGIGASLAGRIVEYRSQNGRFASVEDIKNVSGIGESKFNSIRDFISVK